MVLERPLTEVSISELKRTRLYSEELEIDLKARSDDEYFKWFLASILFGGRISGTIAKNTYRAFARHELLEPRKILAAGWDFLVNPIMREGGYVRYDGRKSTQILRDCEELIATYGGSLAALHDAAQGPADLEDRLQDFFGVGPVTVNIFLRELRPYWRHADPAPLPVVRALAAEMGLDIDGCDRKTVAFIRTEAGLLRLRRKRRRPKGAANRASGRTPAAGHAPERRGGSHGG